ncbi:MAG: AmmeMemoRadiSam system protein B, partial [Casimicrobiaceae bacterium]
MQDVRPAAVAGMFYPDAPERLLGEVRAYLSDTSTQGVRTPKALIVPHAGYIYSGPIAASGFALLAPLR